MPDAQKAVLGLQAGTDVLFLLVGAVLVLAMHAGFAFLEAGTVRHKSQVSALSKSLVGLAASVVVYFFVGYAVSYGVGLLVSARELSGGGSFGPQGTTLAKLVFLGGVAAMVPAIVSGAIAERARLLPHCVAAAVIVGLVYPLLEGAVWGQRFGVQGAVQAWLGEPFHDFAGSIVVHALGGWLAFAAIRRIGPRVGRDDAAAGTFGTPPSSFPLLALGTWLLCLGWLGYIVASAHAVTDATGLVALNALMAMCGGILAATIAGDAEPGLTYNGALAGLVAVCAGADVMHPVGALLVGGVAGVILVAGFRAVADPRRRLDDVRGAWPVHGLCGLWGGVACGVFGLASFGGMGGVSFGAQVVGSVLAAIYGVLAGVIVYAAIDLLPGLRLQAGEEVPDRGQTPRTDTSV